jgi:hypothetical protein
MYKFFLIGLIVIGVIVAYFFIGAEQPLVNDIITTANASANWTGMESAQNAMNAYPIYMWFIPAIVGIVSVVVVLRSRNDGS